MPRGRRNRRVGKQRLRRKRNRNLQYRGIPKTIKVNPIFQRTLRYKGGNVNFPVVTGRCLMNLMLNVVSGSTAAVSSVSSIRLDRIYMSTACAPNDNGNRECVLTWFGGRSPDQIIIANGTDAMPGSITSRPPKDSLAAFWVNLSDSTDWDRQLLSMSATETDMIVDISVSFVLNGGLAGHGVVLLAAATYSGLGYTFLDNATTSGTTGTDSYTIQGFSSVGALATP